MAASAVLVVFLGLTGMALDRAFRESALNAVQDRLQAQVYLLLGAAELSPSNNRLTVPDSLPEARYSTPGSGLYAAVTARGGQPVWQSRSMIGWDIPFPQPAHPGESVFEAVASVQGARLFALSFMVLWQTEAGPGQRYTFHVAESRDIFANQVAGFRKSLWVWLGVATLVLLGVQGATLRWSLSPLRQVARELMEIEAGLRTELTTGYPKEIQHLTGNLNALVHQNQRRLTRYRNALGDLAHSLKTPLAVLSGAIEDLQTSQVSKRTIEEQIGQLGQTVEYQLQRAAASGRTPLHVPVSVAPCARKVVDSLAKVYRDKRLRCELDVASDAEFYGDQGDLFEVLGNLVDNAFKWARSRVIVCARPVTHGLDRGSGLVLEIQDDGPGIAQGELRSILHRGVRADPYTPGHGIGLAVVRDMVEDVYQGTLEIDRGPLGGARVRVRFE